VPVAVSGGFLASVFLALAGAEPSVVEIGAPYLALANSAIFILVLPFVLNACLRAIGNAALAAGFELFQFIAMLLLMPMFVFGFGFVPKLGVVGGMLTLVIIRLFVLIGQLAFFRRDQSIIRLQRSSFKPDLSVIRNLMGISLPSVGQQLIRLGADLILVWLIAGYGTIAVAGYSVGAILLKILETIGQGLGNSVFTVVGQNVGAGNKRRALRGTWTGVGLSALFVGLGALILAVMADSLVAFFTRDPSVIAVASASIRIISASYLFSAITYILIRSLHGAGDTVTPMLVDLGILWAVQLPLAFGLSRSFGWNTNGIWVAIAASNLVRACLLLVLFRARFDKMGLRSQRDPVAGATPF
jgi:Na+-driven multidrug efflux pump